MFERMEWSDVYKLWQRGCLHFPKAICSHLSDETVYVEYKNEGYFYGYHLEFLPLEVCSYVLFLL